MFRKISCLILSAVMISALALQPVAAATKSPEEKRAEMTAKVKEGILKLGVGSDARVQIKTRDKQKIKGWISEVNDENFVVNDAKTGAATTVAYPNVQSAKGNNISTGAAIAIGAAIGAGVALLTLFLIFASFD